MRRWRIPFGLAATAAFFTAGLAASQIGGEPTVRTQTFTHEDVVTYTIPTVTETVVSTVTVTEPTTTEPPPPGEVVRLTDTPFVCGAGMSGTAEVPHVYDLVKVTMGPGTDDAVRLAGCDYVTIKRIEVDTWAADALKVANALPVSDHIRVLDGYLDCHERTGLVHQDGIQAMGGSDHIYRSLSVDCEIAGAGHFFVAKGGAGATTPTGIVCDGCVLGPNPASSTAILETSIESGLRNTVLCPDRTPNSGIGGAFTIESTAVRPVNEGNSYPASC